MNDSKYRFVSPRGLERCRPFSRHWERVTPECIASMTPDELRHIAEVIESKEG